MAELTAASGRRDELLAVLSEYGEVVAREPGVLVFELLADPVRRDVLVALEVYADDAALQAHLAAPARTVLDRELSGLMVDQELRWLAPRSGHGLPTT